MITALSVARSMVERSVGIGLNLYGFLGRVERAGFCEPLALNAVIIPQSTGFVVLDAVLPAPIF